MLCVGKLEGEIRGLEVYQVARWGLAGRYAAHGATSGI